MPAVRLLSAGVAIWTRTIASILVACVVLLAALPVHADKKTSASSSEAQARGHFVIAEKAFNIGRFDEALTSYEAAYDAKPLAGFLFNMAQCHRHLGQAQQAVFFYQRYLALDPQTPNRPLVEQLIVEQQEKLDAEKARVALAKAEPKPAVNPNEKPAFTPTVTKESSGDDDSSGRRWWLWGGITAGVVVAAGVAAMLLIPREGPMPTGDHTIDAR